MDKDLKEYLMNEARRNWHPKYHKYFEEWYSGITEVQRKYFTAWMNGEKTIQNI